MLDDAATFTVHPQAANTPANASTAAGGAGGEAKAASLPDFLEMSAPAVMPDSMRPLWLDEDTWVGTYGYIWGTYGDILLYNRVLHAGKMATAECGLYTLVYSC